MTTSDNKIICPKCNSELPPDSGFCQYCGSKIEDSSTTINNTAKENNAPATEDVVKTANENETAAKILASGIIEGQKAIEANRESQPHNELDADFGLVPHKPVYTVGIDEQEKYLKSLRTINGEPIKWNRRGSMSVDGVNGMVDVYDTYLPSGEKYQTIYVNMYGASNSTFVPKGFSLNNVLTRSKTISKKPKTKYCSRCGSEIDNQTKICTGCGKKYFRGIKINRFSITVAIFILVIITSIIINIIQYNEIDYLSWRETYLQNKVDKLEDEVSDLEDEKWDNWAKLNFFDTYAEIVPIDGTNTYHKWGCSKMDDDARFRIFNTAAVEDNYKKCPYCH